MRWIEVEMSVKETDRQTARHRQEKRRRKKKQREEIHSCSTRLRITVFKTRFIIIFSNIKIFPGLYSSRWVAAKAAGPPPWQPHARLKTEKIAHNQTVDIHCHLNQAAGPEERESAFLTHDETWLPPADELQVQLSCQNFFNEGSSKLTT